MREALWLFEPESYESLALSYDFEVLFIELWLKSYIESWGQTLGM